MKNLPMGANATPKPQSRSQRRLKRTTIELVGIAAFSMLVGFAFPESPGKATADFETPPLTAPAIQTAQVIPDSKSVALPEETAATLGEAHFIEETPGPDWTLLGDRVNLTAEQQKAIWEICHKDERLFCTVMVIANKETRFNVNAIGDSGNSIGLCQINTHWQYDRMERLGVTDLTDYRQNVTVAVDYIEWIAEQLTPEALDDSYGTHALFMAYNQGYWGARDSWSAGVQNTSYSRECTGYFEDYMSGLGVMP